MCLLFQVWPRQYLKEDKKSERASSFIYLERMHVIVYASTLGLRKDRENERACFVAFHGTVPLVSLLLSTDTETL